MKYYGYREFLTADEKRLYDELCSTVLARRGECTVQKVPTSVLQNALEIVKMDLPEVYEFSTFSSQAGLFSKNITIRPVYRPCDGGRERAQIEAERRKILSMITERSDWERALKLHDILCRTVVYRDLGVDSHCIVGPLLHHASVCEGIAHAYKYLCDELNIPCYIVSGTARSQVMGAGPHSWNKVRLGGQWFHVDVTFDLSMTTPKLVRHDYFAVPDEVISRNHVEKRRTHPCTSRIGDYYTHNALVMRDLGALYEEIKRRLRMGGNRAFEFRFPYEMKGALSQKIIETLKRAYSDARRNGSFSVGSDGVSGAYFIDLR